MEDKKKTDEDLGLGSRVIQENRTRFINPDGSFNVRRKGMFERGAFSPYHAMLNISWPQFFVYVFGAYAVLNVIFTVLYLLGGTRAFSGNPLPEGLSARFGELFFYSVQIITTLGSSALQPATVLMKIVFAFEAMAGMLGFAVGAGLIFARISNPAVKIIFSEHALIAPYDDKTAFMFRIINGRSNELVDVSANVTLAMTKKNGKRSLHQLDLERSTVLVFPLNWTVVHPIAKGDPLYGITAEDLDLTHAEFLVTITATDQDLSKRVYARHSYLFSEVIVGAKFKNIIERTADGTVVVDPKRIHEIER